MMRLGLNNTVFTSLDSHFSSKEPNAKLKSQDLVGGRLRPRLDHVETRTSSFRCLDYALTKQNN